MAGNDPKLSWLDDFFGPAIIKHGATYFPKRPVLDLVSTANTNVDVEDDEANDAIKVTFTGNASPGGAVGNVQFYGLDGSDPIFAGTSKLLANITTGEITHAGKPTHKEDYADFTQGTDTCFARSQWGQGATTGASATTIATITLPAADIGDGTFTVHAEVTYSYASGGGNIAAKAVFKRVSGTLTRVGIAPLALSGLTWGTALGADLDIAVGGDNDTILVKATGIASTNINLETSLHIQVATKPA